MKDTLKSGFIIAIILYIFAIIGCLCFQFFRKDYSDWFVEDAVVLDTWKQWRSGRHYYWTKFSYEIDGIKYINKTKGVNINAAFGYDGTNYIKTAVGKTVQIRVNPKNYEESILVDDLHPNKDIWILIMGTVSGFNVMVIFIHFIAYLVEKKKLKNKMS